MYQISEIFCSIQGEGTGVGLPAIFVRFYGCNLSCYFCDTKVKSYQSLGSEEICRNIVEAADKLGVAKDELPGLLCVFTGGEPLLQLDRPLINAVRRLGVKLCLETNASLGAYQQSHLKIRDFRVFENISISPKECEVVPELVRLATQVKFLVPLVSGWEEVFELIASAEKKPEVILQPLTGYTAATKWKDRCRDAMELAYLWRRVLGKECRVIPQTHVFMEMK